MAWIYAPVLDHPFLLLDDDVFLTANPHLAQGLTWESLRWALTSLRAANWFPVTRLSWLLDAQIHGLSPAGVHATNVALHGLTSGALLLALGRATGAWGRSAVVAALFAFHPIQVESVAWASERKGLLAGLFWMVALRVYAGVGPGRISAARLTALTLAAALGLMSKAVVATLPAVLLLLDYWPLGRLRLAAGWPRELAARVAEKAPLWVLSLVGMGLVALAQARGGAVASLEQVGLATRLGNAGVSYVRYARRLVWPSDLAVFYPHPEAGLSALAVAGAAAGLLAVTGIAVRLRRHHPYLLVGWLWYLVTLVPMLGLVQLGSQAMADRYAYLPMVGLAWAGVFGGAALLGRRLPGWAVALVALAAVSLCAVQTRSQVRSWESGVALFERALAVQPPSAFAHAQLARALLGEGRFDEAVAHLESALALRPDPRLANNLAWLLATHPDPARRQSERAVALARQVVAASRGSDPRALDTLAAALAAGGRYDQALLYAGRALRIARARGDEALAAQIRLHMAAYRDGRPFVEPPVPAPHGFD